jgi:hypothetical protein
MSIFEDIGYNIWAKEREKRFIKEGRAGENLGFYNRPDLNDPWLHYNATPKLKNSDIYVPLIIFGVAVISMLVVTIFKI